MFALGGGVWPKYTFVDAIPDDGDVGGEMGEKKVENGWWGNMYKFVS